MDQCRHVGLSHCLGLHQFYGPWSWGLSEVEVVRSGKLLGTESREKWFQYFSQGPKLKTKTLELGIREEHSHPEGPEYLD